MNIAEIERQLPMKFARQPLIERLWRS